MFENKFFGLFQVFYTIEKQAYKFELPIKQKIHDVFYVLLLEQDITRKRRVNKKILLESESEFKAGNNKEQEIKAIINSVMYKKEANN